MTKTTPQPSTAAPDEHSRLVGGSTADLRINCPASYKEEQKLPQAVLEESSVYADEGTACHEAMSYMLLNDIVDASELLGMEFGREGAKFVITRELVDDCLAPAIGFFDALIEELEEESGMQPLWEVEQRVEMPGIPGAFGTCDLVLYTSKRTVVLDWKFGSGVPVRASYIQKDGDEEWEVLNSQLMYYARAAQHSMPGRFGADPSWPVTLIIAQPRARTGNDADRYTRAETDLKELEDFRRTLVARISEAVGDNPRYNRGPHCLKFAKCKSICPKWTGPVLDLTKVHEAAQKRALSLPDPATAVAQGVDLGEFFASALDVLDQTDAWGAEIRRQAHIYMEAGGHVRDRKLVPKRAIRKWRDAEEAVEVLRAAGLSDDDLMETELRSPAQIEKTLKKMKQQLPDELVVAISSGTTVAAEDDRREAVIPYGEVISNFANKLALLAPAK